MQPLFQVIANSIDITLDIADRLMRISVVDERGLNSDSLEIRLDDRDNAVALLPTGALLKVALGQRDNNGRVNLVPMGRYVVDEIELAGPPESYIIRAKSADMGNSLKQHKTRAWDEITMGDLVAKVAQEHGLTAAVDSKLAAIAIPHLSQTEESDLHLLTRLAREHDAMAKPANGHLLFMPKGKAISFTGKAISTVTVNKNQCSDWRVTLADRSKYQAVVTHWQDTTTGNRTAEQVGSGEPVYTLKGTRKTQQAALEAAQAKLQSLKRGQGKGSITVTGGLFEAMAETPLRLVGWRDGINDTWIISRAEHKLVGKGLSSQLEFETPKQ